MWPKARCPQLPTCPAWQAGHGGSMPAGRAARAPAGARPGCRRPARRRRRRRVSSASGAHHLVARARRGRTRCPRSSASCGRPRWPGRTRRCPTACGSTWTQPSAGTAGASRSTSRSGPDPGAPSRAEGRGHPGGGEAWQRPLEEEGAHRPITALGDFTSKGPSGSGRCDPPSALAQCSTCQPRRRAMAESRDSGLTATGKPTASSMARSLAESA